MEREKYILVKHFCEKTHIEDTFVKNLFEYDLITYEKQDNDFFIDLKDISEIERMFRLHNDLGINFEGLDAIKQMLKRMKKLEKEMDLLQKRLRLYE
ncbi:MAG: hypothetical protein COA40_07415 [Aequorivita sp.]|nr:MAG: hypothetical protein COA40_07415 [Aequorivita sp.]